jgi:hypothetical protein
MGSDTTWIILHLVEGGKGLLLSTPKQASWMLPRTKKTWKAKHIDHYVEPAMIVKKTGSRSFQISYTNPLTGTTQLLQRDAGMIILKKAEMDIPLSCSCCN